MVAVWIGVMILGLIGMIVCVQMQKSNPAMQPASVVFFAFLLFGAVMWLRAADLFGGDRRGIVDNELAYYSARGVKIGALLAKYAPGKKVLVLAEPSFEQDIFSKRLVEVMKKKFGGEVTVAWVDVPGNFVEMGAGYQEIATAGKLNAVIDRHAPGAVVSLTGLPADASRMKIFTRRGRLPLIVVGIGAANRRFVAEQLKSGGIAALIEGRRGGGREAPGDPEKAFGKRNVLYTKDNAADFK